MCSFLKTARLLALQGSCDVQNTDCARYRSAEFSDFTVNKSLLDRHDLICNKHDFLLALVQGLCKFSVIISQTDFRQDS